MAQQAVPKGMGQSEFRRAQLTTKSTFVVRNVGLPEAEESALSPFQLAQRLNLGEAQRISAATVSHSHSRPPFFHS